MVATAGLIYWAGFAPVLLRQPSANSNEFAPPRLMVSLMDQRQQFTGRLRIMFAAADPGRRMMLLGIPALVLIGLYTMFQAGAPGMVWMAIGPD